MPKIDILIQKISDTFWQVSYRREYLYASQSKKKAIFFECCKILVNYVYN